VVSDTSEAGKEGSEVKVGDRMTYTISYLNYEEEVATIVVKDKLPVGVDFKTASDGGKYDQATHTVTWTIENVASGTKGSVTVEVEVNSKAVVGIENTATVQVEDNTAQTTNKTINPVTSEEPKKEVSSEENTSQTTSETKNPVIPEKPTKEVSSDVGNNSSDVKVGDRITYTISYLNYEKEAATIVVKDVLPVGVDFKTASDGGEYDEVTHTVTWTIESVASGTKGSVTVEVEVNQQAVISIENTATVQVGDNTPQTTNKTINSVTPEEPTENGSGNGNYVKTSDSSSFLVWSMLALLNLLMIVFIRFKMYKANYS